MFHHSALMLVCGAMLDEQSAVAPCAAASQLRIRLFQSTGPQLGDRYVAQSWTDGPIGELPVPIESRVVCLMNLEPSVECIRQCGLGCRVSLTVDFGEKPRPDLGDLLLVASRLGQVRVLPRDRVDAGVDQYLERVAALADEPRSRPPVLRRPGRDQSY